MKLTKKTLQNLVKEELKKKLTEDAYSDKKLRGHAQNIAKHLFDYIKSTNLPDKYEIDFSGITKPSNIRFGGTSKLWYKGENYYDFPYIIDDASIEEGSIEIPAIDFRFVESDSRSYERGAFIHNPDLDDFGYISLLVNMTGQIPYDKIKGLASNHNINGDLNDEDFKKDFVKFLHSAIPKAKTPRDDILIHELTHAIDKARHGGRHGTQKHHPEQHAGQHEINASTQEFMSSFEEYVKENDGDIDEKYKNDFREFLTLLKKLNGPSFNRRYLKQPKETKQRITNRLYSFWDRYVRN